MSSKTSNEGKTSSDHAGSKTSLVKKLTKNVIKEMSKLRYREWFTADEIDLFRNNADTSQLLPLFERYQDKMEVVLMKHARNNGLETAEALVEALAEARAENPEEWKVLNNLIDSMTEKELFFSMMQGRAERTAAKLSKK